jgi:hypothetical protein
MPDTRKEVQEQIERAEIAAQDTRVVELRVSRQDYRDLVDANRFLRQINPLQKSIAGRLETLGLQIREALDRAGA